MNKFIVTITVLIIFSAQPSFSQKGNGKNKIYENDFFVFHYPNEWQLLKYKTIENKKTSVIVALAKDEPGNTQSKKSLFASFIIYENEFKYKDMDEYMSELNNNTFYAVTPKEKLKINVQTVYTKIDNNHFSSTKKMSDYKVGEKLKFKTTNSFVHYYLYNEKIYSLDLMYSPKLASSISNDAVFIFNSFKFKN